MMPGAAPLLLLVVATSVAVAAGDAVVAVAAQVAWLLWFGHDHAGSRAAVGRWVAVWTLGLAGLVVVGGEGAWSGMAAVLGVALGVAGTGVVVRWRRWGGLGGAGVARGGLVVTLAWLAAGTWDGDALVWDGGRSGGGLVPHWLGWAWLGCGLAAVAGRVTPQRQIVASARNRDE